MNTTNLGVFAALLSSLVVGGIQVYKAVITRSKVDAEAKKTSAEGDVANVTALTSMSADQRAWVIESRSQATEANHRADAAEALARETDKQCRNRCDAQDAKIGAMVFYIRQCQSLMLAAGVTPPTPPASLTPPL